MHPSRFLALLALPLFTSMLIACEDDPQVRKNRYAAVCTQDTDVDFNMVQWLNLSEPKAGGWAFGDPLPPDEVTVPETASASVSITVEGDDFILEASVNGLVPSDTVTDPVASVQEGQRVTGDIWDLWMGSFQPSTTLIQMGTLVIDPDDPTRASLTVDSRTVRDFNGDKISVSRISSIESAFPNEGMALFDVAQIGIDVENMTIDSPPDQQSGQLRLTDAAPLGVPIDWTHPELDAGL